MNREGELHTPRKPDEVPMSQFLLRTAAAVAVCGSLATVALSRADDRSSETILAEFGAIKEPASDGAKHKTRAAALQAAKKRKDAAAQKAKLIGELYRVDPQNPKLITLLPERGGRGMRR